MSDPQQEARRLSESKANRALINDFRRIARGEAEKCPNCGHWMRWSERLNLWRCSWCNTRMGKKP